MSHRVVQLGLFVHGFLGEVAAVGYLPFVVGFNEDGAGKSQ
jgi:hypothetical protein